MIRVPHHLDSLIFRIHQPGEKRQLPQLFKNPADEGAVINRPLFSPWVGPPSVVIDVLRPPSIGRTFRPNGSVDSFAKIDASRPHGAAVYFAGSKPIDVPPLETLLGPIFVLSDVQAIDRGSQEALQGFLRARFDETVGRERLSQILRRFQELVGDITFLIKNNSPSLPSLIDAVRQAVDPDTRSSLSYTIRVTRNWLEREQERYRIRGRVLNYFLANSQKDKKVRKTEQDRLSQELNRWTGGKIQFFDNGGAPLVIPDVPKPVTGLPCLYVDTTDLSGLPLPRDRGDRSFLRMISTLDKQATVAEVKAFFEALEKRLGKEPHGIGREWGYTQYLTARAGKNTIDVKPFLGDQALDRIGLTQGEKNRLRHLETILRLHNEIGQEGIRGPYEAVARLLQYWRIFFGYSQIDFETHVREAGFSGNYKLIERGWVRPGNGDIQLIFSQFSMPPRSRSLLEEILPRLYRKADERQSGYGIAGNARDFPNPRWELPGTNRPGEKLREEIRRITREARGDERQQAFAIRLELPYTAVVGIESKRVRVTVPTLRSYVAFLEKSGNGEDRQKAKRLRVLSAALGLIVSPVLETGSLRSGGRIIRYLRFFTLVSVDDLIRLKLKGMPKHRNDWILYENGYQRMPLETLQAFVALVVKTGMFTEGEADSFVAFISAYYALMGVGYERPSSPSKGVRT